MPTSESDSVVHPNADVAQGSVTIHKGDDHNVRTGPMRFLNSRTGQVIVNTIGNYLNIAFALFFVLLLTRVMGRAEYGVLSVLLGIMYVLANILEFGTTATIYSTFPEIYEKERSRIARFVKSIFYYQTVFSSIVIVILILALPTLDQIFFKTGASPQVLAITSISVLFLIWQNTFMNMMFAVKKFFLANVWLNISNIVKTLVILWLLYARGISVDSVVTVYGIVGPIIFFVFVGWHYRSWLKTIYDAVPHMSELKFRYTLTNFAAQQFFNVGIRMDLFLLSFYGFKNAVGDYGIAQKIMLTVIASVVSVTQVLSPLFASIKTKIEVRHGIINGAKYLMLPTGIFILLTIMPDLVFNLVFTEKFVDTGALTRLMAIPYVLFSFGQLFVLFLLYTAKKPVYLLVSNIIFFLLVTASCAVLIPQKGAYGSIMALSIGFFTVTVIQGAVSWREYKRLPVS